MVLVFHKGEQPLCSPIFSKFMDSLHKTVLLAETTKLLEPSSNQNFIDCTLGDGGHTRAILQETAPRGKVLAIDWDSQAIDRARERLAAFSFRIIFSQDNFKNLKKITNDYQFSTISGIVLDLGISRSELENQKRGFSFLKNASLDMRFNQEDATIPKAECIINNYSLKNLSKIFREYGEERYAARIARAIIAARKVKPVRTTWQLADIIKSAAPQSYQRGKIHPATRVFQALRVEVNRELDNLKAVLPQAVELLEKGGRLAVISFHSLEDRIVKKYFKKESQDCLCPKEFPLCRCEHKARLKLITKRAIKPTGEEIKKNPSSRSAKLRVAEKI